MTEEIQVAQEKVVKWFHDDRWLRVDSLAFAVDNTSGATVCLGKYVEVLKGLQEKEEQKVEERVKARDTKYTGITPTNIQHGDTKNLQRHRRPSNIEATKVREVEHTDIRRTGRSSPHERQVRAPEEHGIKQYQRF